MESVLYALLVRAPEAATIWLMLFMAALTAAGAVAALPAHREGQLRRAQHGRGWLSGGWLSGGWRRWQRRGRHSGQQPSGRQPSGRQRRRRQRVATASIGTRQAYGRFAPASDLRRYAGEVSVAAERATITAHRSRAQWLAAVDEAEAAWTLFDSADAKVRRLAAAAALPEPQTPRTPAEYADRERYLHNAAMAAASRGELPVLQLSDALANRNGWDPRRHPVEQELFLNRARRDAALAAYRAAADGERAAWRDCEIAAMAAQCLRNEAYAARRAVPRASWSDTETVAMPVVAPAARLRTAHAG
jgi:hypothetical protein